MTIEFESLLMPDQSEVPILAVGTDLNLGALKGRVEGKNTRKKYVLRSLSGIGQVGALLVGRGSLGRPLSEEDMLRERLSNNIGEASDEQISRLALSEHVVVTIPAGTPLYVTLEKRAATNKGEQATSKSAEQTDSANVDNLRQLLQLQRELKDRQ